MVASKTSELNNISVVVLVDEDINYDRRVLLSLKGYRDVHVINCRSLHMINGNTPLKAYINISFLIIFSFIRGFWFSNNLKRFYGLSFTSILSGIRISIKNLLEAHKVVENLRLVIEDYDLIHAHDLYCGVIGAELAGYNGARLIYDAHEVEFHRNRNNSWLRSAFEWSVEKRVIQNAQEVRVVNSSIADLYKLLYPGVDLRLRVLLNDHFVSHLINFETIPNSVHATIVYVGQGVRGRQLERLSSVTKDSSISVHAFFIGEIPKIALESGWIIGPSDYEDSLISLVKLCRCMMWCCVENVCLSYRLSLPNKFFQALAVGMPIIAAKDTYLADIVDKYKLGMVFDGSNFHHIHSQMKSELFREWMINIMSFRNDLSNGLIAL